MSHCLKNESHIKYNQIKQKSFQFYNSFPIYNLVFVNMCLNLNSFEG
jgi:hypothetical protein